MSINAEEILTLSDELGDLVEQLKTALSAASPGGKKITRAEGKAIAKAALALAGELVRVLL